MLHQAGASGKWGGDGPHCVLVLDLVFLIFLCDVTIPVTHSHPLSASLSCSSLLALPAVLGSKALLVNRVNNLKYVTQQGSPAQCSGCLDALKEFTRNISKASPPEPGVHNNKLKLLLADCQFNAGIVTVIIEFARSRAKELHGEEESGWREAALTAYRRRDSVGMTPLHRMAASNAVDSIEVVLAELAELSGSTSQVVGRCQCFALVPCNAMYHCTCSCTLHVPPHYLDHSVELRPQDYRIDCRALGLELDPNDGGSGGGGYAMYARMSPSQLAAVHGAPEAMAMLQQVRAPQGTAGCLACSQTYMPCLIKNTCLSCSETHSCLSCSNRSRRTRRAW